MLRIHIESNLKDVSNLIVYEVAHKIEPDKSFLLQNTIDLEEI